MSPERLLQPPEMLMDWRRLARNSWSFLRSLPVGALTTAGNLVAVSVMTSFASSGVVIAMTARDKVNSEGNCKGEANAEGNHGGEVNVEGVGKGKANVQGTGKGEANAEGAGREEVDMQGTDKGEANAEGTGREEADAEGVSGGVERMEFENLTSFVKELVIKIAG